MALFNNKELETLQADNKRLQAELERLQYREESYKSTISTLNGGVEKFREQLLSFQRETEEQAAEIKGLRHQFLYGYIFKGRNKRHTFFTKTACGQSPQYYIFSGF